MYKRLLQSYHELKEAGSASDFPNILADVMYKELNKSYEAVSQEWRKICKIGRLSDFKSNTRVMLHGFGNLDKIVKAGVRVGEYKDKALSDSKYQIQLDTDGLAFTIGREVIINDDQNALLQIPQMLGYTSGRTLNENIVNMIEGDHKAYDGASLFALAHANYGNTSLANTTAGATAVKAAVNAIEKATDSVTGKKLGLKAKYLVTGIDLQFEAEELLKSMQFMPVSTNGGGTYNSIQGRLTPVVLPDITSTTAWYVMADPTLYPTVEVAFLNGKETPDIMVRKPEMVSIAGGDDAYGYEFDDLKYKVRFDYALALAFYQGIYRGKA